jgi:glyoxylase-like metal-dependent hydrolase (beta-lactamase superfamily II)
MLEKVAPGVFLLRGWASFNDISSNVYFLVSSSAGGGGGGNAVAIDCGNSSAQTARALHAAVKELGCEIKAVYCTHGHEDHAGGVAAFPSQTPVYLAKEDFFLLPEEAKPRFTPLKGNAVNFEGVTLEVLRTPGHSPGSVCFFDEKRKILFSGDSLFAGGAFGRTDFPGGDAKALQRSLKTLGGLGWRVLLPGHDDVERA